MDIIYLRKILLSHELFSAAFSISHRNEIWKTKHAKSVTKSEVTHYT